MKPSVLLIIVSLMAISIFAQDKKDKSIFKVYDKGQSFYYNSILKDVRKAEELKSSKKPYKRLKIDVTGKKFPNKVEIYKEQIWHNKPISQGNAGSCWCFSTTSFFESEVYRLHKKEVKLSEIYTVYWEYVEKARSFVNSRGKTAFEQGSESNAVTRIYIKYGIIPLSEYTGLLNNRKFHSHENMYNEMDNYLKSVKKQNAWNEKEVIKTIKSIMEHYIGEPPTKITIAGKEYTPHEYLKDYLKLNMNDYIEILSYMQEPYYRKCSYDVPDNWWNSEEYYNVPLNEYMEIVYKAVEQGYSFVIGGDVSEAGLLASKGDPQVGIIPSFDIPSEYIDENSRQFRFSNKTTTDDHGMHVVGSTKIDGKMWFLVKDSSSGSRNNDENAKEFGYYFFHEDYIKLKIMEFTIHKDVAKDIIKKFK